MSTSIEGIYFRGNLPVSGATVTAQSVDGYSEGSATTDSNGRFSITGLTDRDWLAKATSDPVDGTFYLLPNPVKHVAITSVEAGQHHVALVGFLDSSGKLINPDSNARIQIADDGVINADFDQEQGGILTLSIDQIQIDHAEIGGTFDDDHPLYLAMVGRSGGQELHGGVDSGDDLTLRSTTHETPGNVYIGNPSLFDFDEATGRLALPSMSINGGLLIGGDVLLYRDAQNELRTPDKMTIDGRLLVSDSISISATTGYQLKVLGEGSTNGIVLGGDAQWYRSAENVMRTPDAVTVDGVLTVGTQNIATPDRTIICLAGGGYPTTTNGCSAVTQVEAASNDDYKVLDFDKDADEFAIFGPFALPANYDASTFICRGIHWTTEGGASAETVRWAISLKILANDHPDTQAYGTAVNVDDTWIANGDIHLSGASAAITPGGTAAGGGLLYIRFMRDISGDDLGGDARFISARFTYGTDAISD